MAEAVARASNENLKTMTDVPEIVVRESSPLPVSDTVALDNIPVKETENCPSQTTEPEPSILPESHKEIQVPNGQSVVENETAAPEQTHCTVSVDDNVAGRLTPDIEENDLRTRTLCCPSYGGFYGFYSWVSEMMDSKYSLPFWIILLALPLSAGYMGAKYMDKCPHNPFAPYFFFMLGVTGVILLTGRIMLVLHNTTWEEQIGKALLRSIVLFGCLIGFILFFTEFVTFWRDTPSYDPKSKDYCSPVFHKYVFWTNDVTCSIILLICILKIPSCIAQQRETIE